MSTPSQTGQREGRCGSARIEVGLWGRRDAAVPRLLLTRAEAARALGMSLSHFQRHVQPELRCVRSGQLRLYRPRDLERWLESATAREVDDGQPEPRGCMTLDEAKDRFIGEARQGVALNKWRRPYRPRSVEDLESLNQLPLEMRWRDLDVVSPGEVQELVDELIRRHLSASRIGSVVSALRALYRFARERELTSHDPAREVRLPLSQPTSEHRVVTPAEFACLLEDLWRQTPEEIEVGRPRAPRDALQDALPYALAAYGTARAQEIEMLDWRHVDLRLGGAELAGDEEGRKPGGSWRVIPLVAPLRALLREEWLAQGKPKRGRVCPPQRIRKSGRRSMRGVQRRVRHRWQAHGLEPISLQETRHTAATWLDHAGVSPKICSQIMGHKTPEYQPGAARITLQRYTHVLPGELEHARERLDKFIAERSPDFRCSPVPSDVPSSRN